jgi:hypothetical protein
VLLLLLLLIAARTSPCHEDSRVRREVSHAFGALNAWEPSRSWVRPLSARRTRRLVAQVVQLVVAFVAFVAFAFAAAVATVVVVVPSLFCVGLPLSNDMVGDEGLLVAVEEE